MKKSLLSALAFALLILIPSCGTSSQSDGTTTNPPLQGTGYALFAWAELGMHCIDGADYSVAAVLPPFNTVHAQLVKQGDPPQLVTSGVQLTYEATADSNGSVNTYSAGKTNFWTYVQALFLASPAPDIGLAGNRVQNITPQPLAYNATLGWWEAVGIPTIGVDDSGLRNPYPMAKLVARDAQGTVLAQAKIVLAVSDELSCNHCHASGSNPAAQPPTGWENNTDSAKDVKFNILRLHDALSPISAAVLNGVQAKGYNYQASLYQTAKAGTPILCAACHGSNALGAASVTGVPPLTQSMHALHGQVVNPATGDTLDNATSPFGSCYLCHPGLQTKCQRGAMSGIACFDCHGNLTAVGTAGRQGWLVEPACQSCHNSGTRATSTFDAPGHWRTTPDTIFATNTDVPVAGSNLFRFSKGHGSMYCGACHGAPHAEFPTSQPNDNIYTTTLQGYPGTLLECLACHKAPAAGLGGPHTMHPLGQTWVNAHHDVIGQSGSSACSYCHGWNYRGTFLSQVAMARTFTIEGGKQAYAAGAVVSCYDCHNGPNPG